jgi:hypothetical protein
VHGFDIGDLLPGGVVANELDAICPDDTALHLPGRQAIVLADGVVRGGPYAQDGPLGFMPRLVDGRPIDHEAGAGVFRSSSTPAVARPSRSSRRAGRRASTRRLATCVPRG